MRKILLLSFFLIFTLLAIPYTLYPVHADEIEDLQKQIDSLNHARELSVNATKPLEGQLESLQRQLAQIQATIDNLVTGIAQKQKDLDTREDKLALQQALLEQRVKAYYIRSYLTDPLLVILSSIQAGDLFRELSYRQSVTKEDRQIISSITAEVVSLLTEKEKLEKDKARLALIQADVDKNAKFLGSEIKKAKAYQTDLGKQIAQLSAKQQELLAAKLGSLNISRSAYSMGRCDSDLTNGRDPGFSPKFAAFTYGVPNRVGMNQYGALGRAKAGQGYEEILRAYYNFDSVERKDARINVQGYGTYSLDDYVKRIYEVPDSWTDNGSAALKAQAIAARSYALAYTGGGSGSICTTEQCQVFKPDPKGGNWEQAVNATSGQVMVQGGNAIKAWFSSTHGGYVFSSGEIGWSGTSWTKHANDFSGSVNSFSDLSSSAYDKESPWFYCDWGSRAQYNKTAWLKPEELADIVNVLMLAKKDSGTQVHLSQTDKPNPDGQETWDADRVKRELGSQAFNSISDVSVSADFGSGRTNTVTVSGDGKSVSFNGSEFKNYFNLRAPSNINIVGPLFNVEKR
ncbi:MAG: SpoIID/LytB domain-containing protein [Candidatus Daviesbacteria bacterium]|nr:SpoIID/LytB domain-containing protein [Candidatus Daviesbacteria bacterium]